MQKRIMKKGTGGEWHKYLMRKYKDMRMKNVEQWMCVIEIHKNIREERERIYK